MSKLLKRDREFERNKKEILRRMKNSNPNLQMIDNKINTGNEISRGHNDSRYAWEYEIEEYRKKKNLERFYKIGAFSGIASLIITIMDKILPIKEITYTAINYILK